jgi:hypothetical protein
VHYSIQDDEFLKDFHKRATAEELLTDFSPHDARARHPHLTASALSPIAFCPFSCGFWTPYAASRYFASNDSSDPTPPHALSNLFEIQDILISHRAKNKYSDHHHRSRRYFYTSRPASHQNIRHDRILILIYHDIETLL